jgi:hypothetical protein
MIPPVKLSDMMFEGQDRVPAWAASLRRELRAKGGEASPAILTPLAALDEVAATTAALIEGRGEIPEADRSSLGQDVSASLKALGRSTRDAVAAVLSPFQANEVRLLAQLLTDVEGARRLAVSARVVLDELCLPAVSEAAWDDCVAAFRDGDDAATCQLRIAQLRELCVRRGHSWETIDSRVSDLLTDRRLVAAATGATDRNDDDFNPSAPAGLPWERRLELCRGVVGAPVLERASIVWLAYLNADMQKGFMRVGPVQFFTHRLTLEDIRDGCPALNSPEFERPEELADPFANDLFEALPEPYVLVRVALEPGRIPDIGKHARDLVAGLVDVVNPSSEWVLSTGAAMHSSGGWWGTYSFRDPEDFKRARRSEHRHDHTDEALADFDGRFVSALFAGDDAAHAAVAEQRWLQAVDAAPDPAQRIALTMRTLERALPIPRGAQESLAGAMKRHLLDAWCFDALSREVWDAAYYTIHHLPREGEPSLRDELIAEVFPWTGSLSFTFERAAFIARADELIEALPDLSIEQRVVSETAARMTSGAEALRRLAELEAAFGKLMARTMRQRNAVVHGAATVPAVVETCAPFIRGLAGLVARETISAAITNEEPLLRLEHGRAAWLRQREALRRGAPPVEVLFRGDLRGDKPEDAADAGQQKT